MSRELVSFDGGATYYEAVTTIKQTKKGVTVKIRWIPA